jgi:Tfp pilus assembly protein PilF
MYMRALQGYEESLGPKHTSTLNTVNNLGLLYADQGKLDQAEGMYMRALQGYEEAVGYEMVARYIPALHTMENLGDLFITQRDQAGAESMYKRSLAGYQVLFGPSSDPCQELEHKIAGLSSITVR